MTDFDLDAVAERDVITPGMQVRILTDNVLLTVAERDRLVAIAREVKRYAALLQREGNDTERSIGRFLKEMVDREAP